MLQVFFIAALLVSSAGTALGQPSVRASDGIVRVCEAIDIASGPPDFSSDDCSSMQFWDVDPQGTALWVEARIIVDEAQLMNAGPRGVQVSGFASSSTWLNDTLIGHNGTPALTRNDEIPGRMDVVHYAPQSLLRDGENKIVLLMSSHHGMLDLFAPMHALELGPFRSPTTRILQAYWPSLMMMSVFALSALVFTVMAVQSEAREGPAILAALSLCLVLMLLSEALRGLVAYRYPLHAWRLIAITGFGWLAGNALVAHVLQRFCSWRWARRWLCVAGAAGLSTVPMLISSGFDAKTGYAILTAILISGGICVWLAIRQTRGTSVYVIGLGCTSVVLLVTETRFLDFHLYWLGAAFLFALFVRQALALVQERRRRVQETERANRLDAALASAQQASAPSQLKLVSGTTTKFVSTDDIVSLNGAGDYVELRFKSGRTALHNATLTELEKDLPDAFLRVHRSCIVNTAFVEGLERDAGGSGRLMLTGGGEAPVSRRILPYVKTRLEAGLV